MALTIYGQAQSRTSRVLWLAKELGLPFEHVAVNQRAGETRKPDFLKINRYLVSVVPYFVKKLTETPAGESKLLDNTWGI